MKNYIRIFILFLIPGYLHGNTGKFTVHNDGITVLMAKDAVLQGGLKPYRIEPTKVFWVENWTNADQRFTWELSGASAGRYKVNILCASGDNVPDTGREISLELAVNGKKTVVKIPLSSAWNRYDSEQTIALDDGNNSLSLGLTSASGSYSLQLYSIELVRPQVEAQIKAQAAGLQSRPRWFSDAGYGFFFHWNSRSMPRRGDALTYNDAVEAFDVAAFAETIHECGADFIIFTTSWAEYYFPAPLQSIDKILPGRTSRRDLVNDLSDELSKYGIKLMLYYHMGHDDTQWWHEQGFNAPDTDKLFTNIQLIAEEISMRYKEKVAGLFLDDGMVYYSYNAPFEAITKAAKKGNRDMLVAYNSWIFPKFTHFQDYYTGERGIGRESAEAWGWNIDSAGYFTSGPQTGLRATFCGLLEPGDWTHLPKDTDIPSPYLSAGKLIEIVQTAIAARNLPVMNVSVYQDGSISPETFRLLKELNRAIRKKPHPGK